MHPTETLHMGPTKQGARQRISGSVFKIWPFSKNGPEDQEFIFFDESKLSFERNQFLRKLKKKKRKRTLQPTSTNASSFYGGCSAARDRTGLGSSSKARIKKYLSLHLSWARDIFKSPSPEAAFTYTSLGSARWRLLLRLESKNLGA